VPAEERGRIWRVRQSPPASAVLRIAGAGPVVSLSPDAVFTPTLAPAPDAVPPPDAPPAWSEPVLHIAAGTPFSVPRGPKTGDHTYQHVHVREGTLEFWLRADTDDSSVANPTFLSFGGLSLWRRTQLGTYYNLGKGFLQSGFLIRPRVWYHLALTWRLGDERHKPEMNLFINGVAMAQLMQTALPADAGDWTAENLNLGMNEPMHITGLRISAVARDQELERGVLSPPPDKNTLYWQHNGAEAK
jgi:hypothetical protein